MHHSTAQNSKMQHSATKCNKSQHSTAKCSTAQHDTAQHSKMQQENVSTVHGSEHTENRTVTKNTTGGFCSSTMLDTCHPQQGSNLHPRQHHWPHPCSCIRTWMMYVGSLFSWHSSFSAEHWPFLPHHCQTPTEQKCTAHMTTCTCPPKRTKVYSPRLHVRALQDGRPLATTALPAFLSFHSHKSVCCFEAIKCYNHGYSIIPTEFTISFL